jgi:hypothetical protein
MDNLIEQPDWDLNLDPGCHLCEGNEPTEQSREQRTDWLSSLHNSILKVDGYNFITSFDEKFF